jgi:hypothetical protein
MQYIEGEAPVARLPEGATLAPSIAKRHDIKAKDEKRINEREGRLR